MKLSKQKITITLFTFIMCVCSFAQTSIISINPDDGHQAVTFGGDNKLTIKSWAERNVDAVSSKLRCRWGH